MSSRRSYFPALLLATITPVTVTPNGDSSFQGNRRPGILEVPSEVPTGENALLYRRIGRIRPDELLDLVSETQTPDEQSD